MSPPPTSTTSSPEPRTTLVVSVVELSSVPRAATAVTSFAVDAGSRGVVDLRSAMTSPVSWSATTTPVAPFSPSRESLASLSTSVATGSVAGSGASASSSPSAGVTSGASTAPGALGNGAASGGTGSSVTKPGTTS
ncbi:hypothetical protein CPER28S_02265 [Cellulomonas persica]